MDRQNALTGVLVADAAALGLHWLYDQQQIARVESAGGVLFRQPDANTYNDVKGYFAHDGRTAGQLSHYGESARLTASVCRSGSYSTEKHQSRFMTVFGPCGSFRGYADRPTKALIGRLLNEGDDLQNPSGMDDDQHPGLCPIAAVFAAGLSEQMGLSAVQVISVNTQVMLSAQILYRCLDNLSNGMSLVDTLEKAATADSGPMQRLLQEALAFDAYKPLEAAEHFGLACHVQQGLPLVWHLLRHADSFEAAVRDNIRCGGDSCGRAMVLGALAGMAFGVPEHLADRVDPAVFHY